MSDNTIDTTETMQAVHRALAESNRMPPGPKRDDLRSIAISAMSAAVVYARHPNPAVLQKHYDAVQRLLDYAKDMPDAEEE